MKQVLMLRQTDLKTCSLLVKGGQTHEIGQSAEALLAAWCLTCGSSLQGRRDWVRHHFGAVEKIPILISERTQLLYFPIYGMRSNDAIWLCANELMEVSVAENGQCAVWFRDGTKAVVPCSDRVIKKQRRRCRKILDFLNGVQEHYSDAGSLLEQIQGGWKKAGCIEEERREMTKWTAESDNIQRS